MKKNRFHPFIFDIKSFKIFEKKNMLKESYLKTAKSFLKNNYNNNNNNNLSFHSFISDTNSFSAKTLE